MPTNKNQHYIPQHYLRQFRIGDTKPFDPVGLVLDEATMLYGIDVNFDIDTWKADIEDKRSQTNFSLSEIIVAIDSGCNSVPDIHLKLGGADAGSRRSLERIVAKGKKEDLIRCGKKGYRLTQKGKTVLAKISTE